MVTTTTAPAQRPPTVVFSEIVAFAFDSFRSNKVRFMLTGLGMVIGTASLILVVTIGMTGKQYVLNQIQSIGANLIYAEYQSGGQSITNSAPDPLTVDDMKAAQQAVPGIVAASPVIPLGERIPIGNGQERDIQILGVYPEYLIVRNLVVVSGRFFDAEDEQAHNKVGVVTQKMAEAIYGSSENAVGKVIKLNGLPFTIIGTFRERVNTFGQSEVTDNTMTIPYTVARYFSDTPTVKQIYFSVADSSMVSSATDQIKRVIQSRHRAESVYNITNLTELVAVAEKTANALTVVLLAVATIVLLVSGIGIMNIMLATVSARIREIGIRKALGATNREIRFQFLSEAILISVGGGLIGVVIGLAIPYSVRFLTEYRIPISGLSAIVAIVVSSLVGILFGTVPATRASKLDPVESLRYE
ncbi:MAG: ABC transporter permease [Acidobacteriota bacterium]|jgi:putative ABC transport system permease protein|nr:ABC transporter permease [Acidobacteriota bacterium]